MDKIKFKICKLKQWENTLAQLDKIDGQYIL